MPWVWRRLFEGLIFQLRGNLNAKQHKNKRRPTMTSMMKTQETTTSSYSIGIGMGDGFYSILTTAHNAGIEIKNIMKIFLKEKDVDRQNNITEKTNRLMTKLSVITSRVLITMYIISFVLMPNVVLAEDGRFRNKEEFSHCVFLLDGSKSYNYLDKARQSIKSIVHNYKNCVKINVRWISEDSYLDNNIITSALLHDTSMLRNPFSLVEKRKKKIMEATNDETRKELMAKVRSAKSPESSYTDIYGALMASSARFVGSSDFRKNLFIFSDMVDNADKKIYRKPRLDGVNVYVVDFQSMADSEDIKKYWSEFLKSIGAISVEFSYIDESVNIKKR